MRCISTAFAFYLVKGLGIFASDSKQILYLAHATNKPLGQSGIPWLLQADRMSDHRDIYNRKSKFKKKHDITDTDNK